MNPVKISCLAILLCASQLSIADAKTLKVNDSNDPNGPYTINMIKLALDHIAPCNWLQLR